jgi:hypothetical protein
MNRESVALTNRCDAHVIRNDDRDAAEQAAVLLIGDGWDLSGKDES